LGVTARGSVRMAPSPDLRSVLRDAIGSAMKGRDPILVAAFRSALGVIDNAQAADISEAPAVQSGTIAGGVAGLGAGEVPRRALPESQLVEILRAEVAQWEASAAEYQRRGRVDSALRLYAEAEALTGLLDLVKAA
jgi:uncharacterized protein